MTKTFQKCGETGDGGSLPRLTSITERSGSSQSTIGEVIASLGSGQALQEVLNVPTPVSISAIVISGSSAQTVDKVRITTDEGIIFDGPITLGVSTSRSFLVGYVQQWINSSGTITGASTITPTYGADYIIIEIDATSSTSTIEVSGIIDNIL